METVNMDDFKKEGLRRKAEAVVDWMMAHPAETLVAATLVAGVIKKTTSVTRARLENRRRSLDIYDPRTGVHCWLKRSLTPTEKLIIDERYRRGESYTKILYELKLLK